LKERGNAGIADPSLREEGLVRFGTKFSFLGSNPMLKN